VKHTAKTCLSGAMIAWAWTLPPILLVLAVAGGWWRLLLPHALMLTCPCPPPSLEPLLHHLEHLLAQGAKAEKGKGKFTAQEVAAMSNVD